MHRHVPFATRNDPWVDCRWTPSVNALTFLNDRPTPASNRPQVGPATPPVHANRNDLLADYNSLSAFCQHPYSELREKVLPADKPRATFPSDGSRSAQYVFSSNRARRAFGLFLKMKIPVDRPEKRQIS